jgi:multidrug efflux system membrane fusion protein
MSIHKYQVALCSVAIAAGCGKPPAKRTPSIPVTVAVATQIAAPHTLEANGVVEPLRTVAVEAQVGGTLDSVEFREGEDVQTGEVLFRIDPRPFQAALRQAEATLARDVAQAQSAQRDAERYQALVAKDYVTKSQADQAVAAAAALNATVQADSAAVDNARLNLGYTTIRAPIAGRTGRLLVKQGNLVKANADPLVVINTLHPITVRFPVVQRDFPELQRRTIRGNLPVRVVTADSGRVGDVGRLNFLDNEVDSLTGSVVAKAQFDNQMNALWPGEYVRVSVQLDVKPNAVAVPSSAVLPGQSGSYVFVVGADKVAKVRPITVGEVIGQLTTVDSGLVVGEHVVVDGQSRLTPNAHVDVRAPTTETATTQAVP